MLRAIGPSLESRGIAGAVPDTTLELVDSAGDSVTNDDWKVNDATQASQQAEIEATGIPPTSDFESAIVADLAPGFYTAILRGKDAATGVAVAEVYDLDTTSAAQLANISTRGKVDAGDDAMIGGVIVSGSGASRVLVRALGPSLTGTVPTPLQNPTLELRDPNGALIETNDDWQSSHEAEISATGIPPKDERESAIVATLFPGNYTAVVRGAGDSTGIALVEAYRID